MELSGTWRAMAADDTLRRHWLEDGFDDGAWAEVTVPGHWRSHPALAGCDGPVLHRRRFESPSEDLEGRRWWLVFDGVFDQGDIWLDGTYLGDTESYFARHDFEVTPALAARGEHTLAVEVACATQHDLSAKTDVTGLFGHPEAWGDWNPGGLWAPVRLEHSGPVRIAALGLRCREATELRAVLELRATLDADTARTVELVTEVGSLESRAERPLAAGANELAWTVVVDRPRLWWPRALGEPVLHPVRVAVHLDDVAAGGTGPRTCSHERVLRTGLRQVALSKWITTVNGERLFTKGTCQGPNRRALGEATSEELRADIAAVAETGLDLLRLRGHVSRPEVYDAADEVGLLVWQDLPLRGRYARSVRPRAAAAAKAMVATLGHHPCIAIWCGHDEPAAPGARGFLRSLPARQLPDPSGARLDRRVARTLGRADPSRPVVAHAGAWPRLGELTGSAPTPGLGWEWGEVDDLATWLRRLPRLGAFASGFGAASVPDSDEFCEPWRWPDLDWQSLAGEHGMPADLLGHRVPPEAHADFEGWKRATQRYQAELVRHYVEHLRRLKYRPAGGFTHGEFADGHPSISPSLVDHRRRPKEALAAFAAACRPVIVVAEVPPRLLSPGQHLGLDVHVVSDRREPIELARVEATLHWRGGRRLWRWEGAVPVDACVRVGRVDAVVPDAPGPARLDLVLEHGDERVENGYRSEIASGV